MAKSRQPGADSNNNVRLLKNTEKNLTILVCQEEVNNLKIRLIAVCVTVMVVCFYGFASGDEIIYSQNFDGLDDGDITGQDGWESIDALTAGLGSLLVQGDVTLTGVGKALQAEALHENHIKWETPVEAGTCYLSIFFRKEDTSSDNTLHIYMGKGALGWSAGAVIRIGAQSGDPEFIGIHDGSDANIVQADKFVVGEWHHIREVLDVDNTTFDVYLDGEKLGNYGFRNATHNTIEWLMIGFDAGVDLLGYYDSIEFGTGTGEGAFNRAISVEPAGKLVTTWSALKAYLR